MNINSILGELRAERDRIERPEFAEVRSAAIECQKKFLAERGKSAQ